MPPIPSRSDAPSRVLSGMARVLLALLTAASFLLVFHNYGLDLLPDRRIRVDPAQITPYGDGKTFAYVVPFDASEPDRWPTMRSRVRFFEDATAYRLRLRVLDEVTVTGGDRFVHEPGRIVFSTLDNTDPRTNGHAYWISTPIWYTVATGDAAMLVFLACVVGWHLLCRGVAREPRPHAPIRSWRGHFWGATALFLAGLYCNTGSLPPYAITSFPLVDPATGYTYNGDHVHFRVLFDFVNGANRSVWDHAILLRRILFPVLGWPMMRLFGFEVGGILTSLALSTAAFAASLSFLRRWIGENGAACAGWIMAVYPGAAYWAGLPYTYALIFPASLLLMLALVTLAESRDWRTLAMVSVGMGVAYLAYDLAITFLPAAFLVLCWRRRFGAAVVSTLIQIVPLALWLLALVRVFHQPLQNGNSGIYLSILSELTHPAGLEWWLSQAAHAPGYGSDIFFASNFIFIPALFLAVVALNPSTSRIRMHVAEAALLLSGLAFFAVLNLAPSDSGGWEMRGNWISRLYQPIFPALVLFISRWWQDLPPVPRAVRGFLAALLAGATLGDALIVFGPILNDPWHLSRDAFYRFYDHTDAHFVYDEHLATFGRRPLGFTRVIDSGEPRVTLEQLQNQIAAAKQSLLGIRKAIWDNRVALHNVRTALRDVGRAAAQQHLDLYSKQLALRRFRGEITAEQSMNQVKTLDSFISPEIREVIDDASLDSKESTDMILPPLPPTADEVRAAIVKDSAELTSLEHEVTKAENELTAALADQTQAINDMTRFLNASSAPSHP